MPALGCVDTLVHAVLSISSSCTVQDINRETTARPSRSKDAMSKTPKSPVRDPKTMQPELAKGRGGSPFPVVGIGASAGGLEASTQLLKHLPPDTGMAFVLVQHLDPTHASALTEILSRDSIFDDFEVEHEFPRIGRKRMLLNARRIVRKDNNLEATLLAIEDLTERTTPP